MIVEKNGILLVNKPGDITSFKVCESIKEKLKIKKIGHGGTLDPMATGLMIIGVNKGTKLLPYFIDAKKEYQGKMILGEKRDSFDIMGKILEKKDFTHIKEDLIKKTVNFFLGEIEQKPPIFSAIKHKGKPLYKYARKGINIEKEKRKIFIEKFEILNVNIPEIEFYIKCSKGTYIRSIANDFGIKLGTYAYLSELKRVAIGDFKLKDAIFLEDVKPEHIIEFENIFKINRFSVKEEYVKLFENGNPLLPEYLNDFKYSDKFFYIYSDNFIGLGDFIKSDGIIKVKLLHKKTLH